MTIDREQTTGKGRIFNSRVLAMLVSAGVILTGAGAADAARRQITFVNNTGGPVDDLHIVAANQGVTVVWDGATTPFPSDNGRDGQKTHNFWGATVPANGSAVVTLTNSSTNLLLSKWWWTRGGNAVRNGAPASGVGRDDGGAALTAPRLPARGDGMVQVSVGGMVQIFQTRPGASAEETIADFAAFLDTFMNDDSGFDLIHSFIESPDTIVAAGNVLGDPYLQLQVEILQQDSDQPLQVDPLQETAPQTRLEFEGDCPGEIALTVTNATPGGRIYLVYSTFRGETEVPGCDDEVVALDDPKIGAVIYASNEGGGTYLGYVPYEPFCGRVYVQAVDFDACWATNTILIE